LKIYELLIKSDLIDMMIIWRNCKNIFTNYIHSSDHG